MDYVNSKRKHETKGIKLSLTLYISTQMLSNQNVSIFDAELYEKIKKHVGHVSAIINVNTTGDIISYYINPDESDEELYFSRLQKLALTIPTRFYAGGFYKMFDGLEFSLSIFKKQNMVVHRLSNKNFLIILLQKTADLDNTLTKLSHLFTEVFSSGGIKKIPNIVTDFQKQMQGFHPLKKFGLVTVHLKTEKDYRNKPFKVD